MSLRGNPLILEVPLSFTFIYQATKTVPHRALKEIHYRQDKPLVCRSKPGRKKGN